MEHPGVWPILHISLLLMSIAVKVNFLPFFVKSPNAIAPCGPKLVEVGNSKESELSLTRYNNALLRLRNDLYCVEWGVKLYSLTAVQR